VTSNAERATTLVRALGAAVAADQNAIDAVFAEDVKAWGPGLAADSRSELLAVYERRDDAFDDVTLEAVPLDVGGEFAAAEWTVTMTHTGAISFGDTNVEPTGLRVTVHGIAVAEFRGEQICALRQYWDEFALLEELGVLAARAEA
jgi:ketosteroid isomerase-like protein